MNKKHISIWVTALILTLSSSAHATLLSRLGGQAYYDTDSNLIWLADANVNGRMQWAEANSWATSLNIDGVTGWRLPDTQQPDSTCSLKSATASYGYGCTGSEFGNLLYNTLGATVASFPLAITDPFFNVQSDIYWSATEYDDLGAFWGFNVGSGAQIPFNGTRKEFAWAVRSGDITAALYDVPEPDALWLLLGAGLVLIVMKRQRMTSR